MSYTPLAALYADADSGSKIVDLPEDVLIRIVRFLDPRETVIFGSVCKRFARAAVEDRLVWAPICTSIVGARAATSPECWGAPSFQRLYARLLRTYGGLLAGSWHSQAEPLGSLLVAFPAPPYIIGAIVVSLRLAEPGVTVVPVFRVSYDPVHGEAVVRCLRARNNDSNLSMTRLREQVIQPEPDELGDEELHEAELQLSYEHEKPFSPPSPPPPRLPLERNSSSEIAWVNDATGASGGEDLSPGRAEPGGAGASEDDDDASAAPAAEGIPGTAGGAAVEGAARRSSPGRRPRPYYCWGCRGPGLSEVVFTCSGGCRHQEVEAVCRWAPAGARTLITVVAAEADGPADSNAGSSAAGTGLGTRGSRPILAAPNTRGSVAVAPAPPLAGDLVVDLDVLANHLPYERLQFVGFAMYYLMVRQVAAGPVSYRRVQIDQCPASVRGELAPATGPDRALSAGTGPAPGPAAAPDAQVSQQQRPATGGPALGEGSSSCGVEVGVRPAAGEEAVPGPGAVPRAPCSPLHSLCHALGGVWRGTYGAHGIEFLLVRQAGPHLLEAYKLTGDDNVPAGETSVRVFLDRPGRYAGQRGSPFRLPPDYAPKADVTGLGLVGRARQHPGADQRVTSTAPRPEALVLDSFEAVGQVAGSGFQEPQWISAEAVILGNHTFGVLWHDIRSFSAFRRMLLPEGFPS